MVLERADTPSTGGAGEVEPHLDEMPLVGTAEPRIHRPEQHNRGRAECRSDVPRTAVCGDEHSGPSQHRLGETEGKFRLVGEALHRRMIGRADDSAGLVAVAGTAVHEHPGSGQPFDRQLRQRRKAIGPPGFRRAVGAVVIEDDQRPGSRR